VRLISLKNLFQYQKTIFFLLPFLIIFFYLASIDIKYSVAGDGTGKWQQTKDIIPLFDFSCSYNYKFDRQFKYIPGANYFYFFEKEKCSHMYSYPFAYLYAPFLYLFSDYGIYIFNYFSWLLFIFSFANICKLAVTENKNSYFYGGLFSIFIAPSIYAIGLTEVTVTISLGLYALRFIYASLRDLENKNAMRLIFSGLILGLIFGLRTESIIYSFSICISSLFYFILNKEKINTFFSFAIPLGIGLLVGLGFITISHYLLFGNILGFRGMNAANLIKDGFNFRNQLEIVRLQLFAGNRGLFTSMPIILFSSFYFFKKKKTLTADGVFFILIATLSTLIIVLTTPWGDFADWTPRYLALAFAPFLISVLQISLSNESELLKNKLAKWILIILLSYSLLFNFVGFLLSSKITNMLKNINLKIESVAADTIVIDTQIPYIYITQSNFNKPIFSLRLDESDTIETGKKKFIELVSILDQENNSRRILVIQAEGISKFSFIGDEIQNWKSIESSSIMKKVKFLVIEKEK
jgi:hypothetical protein